MVDYSENNFDAVLDSCLDKLERELDYLAAFYPRFPHSVVPGGKEAIPTWHTSGDEEWKRLVNGYWTGGFWIGMLYIAEKLTGRKVFADWAERWMEILAPRAQTTGMHDLGFLFFPSAVLGYELTGNEDLAEIAITAASNVAGQYNSFYRCLTIFDRAPMDRIMAIDTMMNLPLLWWAAEKTGNEMWRRIARNHSDTAVEFAVRPDGGMFHIVKFAHLDRKADELGSWQGLAPDSCWSRGLAWAVAGYAYAHLFSGEKRYHDVFSSTLNFFSDHLPENQVPLWDLQVADNAKYEWDREPKDSSALAAVIHSLLIPGVDAPDGLAEKWMAALIDNCLAPPDEPGFLKHVCFHKPAKIDTDISCVFADYFFLLSLAQITGRLEFPFSK